MTEDVVLYAEFTALEGQEATVRRLVADLTQAVQLETGNRVFMGH